MPAFGKRRALGQHFLKDAILSEKIAAHAVENAFQSGSAAILEIGPGRGALTHPLVELLAKQPKPIPLLLCERDRDLAARWKVREENSTGLQVFNGDFLNLPEEEWLSKAPLYVVSNLPYSAGTAILTRLAAHPTKIRGMTLMFQAEVAQRLRAEPDTRSWGSLSIWIQNQWEVKKLYSVPPGAFAPPPDVDSEVVALLPKKDPFVALRPGENAQWEGLLKAAFAHRRKMLRSSLPEPYKNALVRAGLDGTKRAEALGWDEWKRFFAALLN